MGTVADICGVSHGPVSRFFKECVNYGYLTEQYTFTEAGTRALRMYERILQVTQSYLTRLGVSEESRQESLRQLIENVDYELLLSITRRDTQVKKDTTISQESSTPNFLEKSLKREIMRWGSRFHQVNRTGGGPTPFHGTSGV